ncbi:MAG: hypothetical protein MZU95_11005 [Desulfomicrobium escambiense]|nr:hypothetical protein [Desulfomicrobium escambiense]
MAAGVVCGLSEPGGGIRTDDRRGRLEEGRRGMGYDQGLRVRQAEGGRRARQAADEGCRREDRAAGGQVRQGLRRCEGPVRERDQGAEGLARQGLGQAGRDGKVVGLRLG